MPDPTLTVRHCVICDDVRLEVSNKETIVGVYTVGMTAPLLPWLATVCVWMPVIWGGDGDLDVEIRVVNPVNQQVGIVVGRGTSVWAGFESTLTFRGLSISLDMEGFYSVEWRVAHGSWQRIRQFPIYLLRTPTTGS